MNLANGEGLTQQSTNNQIYLVIYLFRMAENILDYGSAGKQEGVRMCLCRRTQRLFP